MSKKTKLITWKIEKRKLNDLKPHPKNPRNFTEKGMKDLENSINSIGFMQPININQDGTILSGHARALKLKEMGEIEVDVYVPDRVLTPKQEEEILIRANANTAGQWDWDFLANEWEIDELGKWGLEVPNLEFSEDEQETIGDDDVPDEPKKTITVKGDLYQLGGHRLLCGCSTMIYEIEKLMDGKKADMVFTDPPYGMKKEKDGVLNDNLNYDDLLELNKQWIPLSFINIKENGSWYCWGTDEPLMDIYSEILKPLIKCQKITFRNLITWDKGNGQGQNSDNTRSYAIADEKCLFVMCGVQGFNNNADNYFEGWEPIRDYLLQSRLAMGWDVPTMKKIVGHRDLLRDHWTSKSQFNMPTEEVYSKMKAEADRLRSETKNEAFKKEYEELKKEYYSTRAFFNNTHDNFNNVWHFDRHLKDGMEGGHPTPKPIELCIRAIKSSSKDGDIILDLFLGSGSTLIACEKTKRICYGIELEPKYCDIIVKRYIDFCEKNNISPIVKRNGKICLKEFKNLN